MFPFLSRHTQLSLDTWCFWHHWPCPLSLNTCTLTRYHVIKQGVDVVTGLGTHLPALNVKCLLEFLNRSLCWDLSIALQIHLVAHDSQHHILNIEVLIYSKTELTEQFHPRFHIDVCIGICDVINYNCSTGPLVVYFTQGFVAFLTSRVPQWYFDLFVIG